MSLLGISLRALYSSVQPKEPGLNLLVDRWAHGGAAVRVVQVACVQIFRRESNSYQQSSQLRRSSAWRLQLDFVGRCIKIMRTMYPE